ncbi:MAG: cupin domain-containing protein [Rhodobacteraceae bacterium]|nr:cupin domain-containing protein [Paracoccaceae bacterium]
MPKLDLSTVRVETGSGYPGTLAAQVGARTQQRVGAAGGLSQFGANIVTLPAGALSSLRHWHEQQDEILIVLSGELTLVDDNGETPLRTGDVCTFPAGEANGHQIVNNTSSDGSFFVVGTHTETETAWYSDLDMMVTVNKNDFRFTRKDGSPLPKDI